MLTGYFALIASLSKDNLLSQLPTLYTSFVVGGGQERLIYSINHHLQEIPRPSTRHSPVISLLIEPFNHSLHVPTIRSFLSL